MADTAETLVVIATYNERETLPQLVREVFATLPETHILVVDDNSPDGTWQWCEEFSAQDARLRCLRRPAKLGLGTAITEGLQYGIDQGYRYIITMDADFSHPPQKLPELLAAIQQQAEPAIDVVIGSRYVPGGKIEGWPWYRRLMSWAMNLAARLLLGLPIRDCSGNFRCYRAATVARLDWDTFCSKGFSFFEEILFHLRRDGARFCEIPICFIDRQKGQSKMSCRDAIAAVLTLLRLAVVGRCRRPPKRH